MKKRGLGGPDDVGGVLGRACAPPLLFRPTQETRVLAGLLSSLFFFIEHGL
jgi:hypothetical protein